MPVLCLRWVSTEKKKPPSSRASSLGEGLGGGLAPVAPNLLVPAHLVGAQGPEPQYRGGGVCLAPAHPGMSWGSPLWSPKSRQE